MSVLDEHRRNSRRRLSDLALYVMLAAIAVAAWGIVTRLQASAALERATEAAAVQHRKRGQAAPQQQRQ